MKNQEQKNPARRRGPRGRAARSASLYIGTRLRTFYDQVLAEPMPSHFRDLLTRLDHAGRNGNEQERC